MEMLKLSIFLLMHHRSNAFVLLGYKCRNKDAELCRDEEQPRSGDIFVKCLVV